MYTPTYLHIYIYVYIIYSMHMLNPDLLVYYLYIYLNMYIYICMYIYIYIFILYHILYIYMYIFILYYIICNIYIYIYIIYMCISASMATTAICSHFYLYRCGSRIASWSLSAPWRWCDCPCWNVPWWDRSRCDVGMSWGHHLYPLVSSHNYWKWPFTLW